MPKADMTGSTQATPLGEADRSGLVTPSTGGNKPGRVAPSTGIGKLKHAMLCEGNSRSMLTASSADNTVPGLAIPRGSIGDS